VGTRYFKSNDDIGTATLLKNNDGTDNGTFLKKLRRYGTRYSARYFSNEKTFSIDFSAKCHGYCKIIQKLHHIFLENNALIIMKRLVNTLSSDTNFHITSDAVNPVKLFLAVKVLT